MIVLFYKEIYKNRLFLFSFKLDIKIFLDFIDVKSCG